MPVPCLISYHSSACYWRCVTSGHHKLRIKFIQLTSEASSPAVHTNAVCFSQLQWHVVVMLPDSLCMQMMHEQGETESVRVWPIWHCSCNLRILSSSPFVAPFISTLGSSCLQSFSARGTFMKNQNHPHLWKKQLAAIGKPIHQPFLSVCRLLCKPPLGETQAVQLQLICSNSFKLTARLSHL